MMPTDRAWVELDGVFYYSAKANDRAHDPIYACDELRRKCGTYEEPKEAIMRASQGPPGGKSTETRQATYEAHQKQAMREEKAKNRKPVRLASDDESSGKEVHPSAVFFDPSAVFVAEGGGHPKVNGPYAQFGTKYKKPQYYKIDESGNKLKGDEKFHIFWSNGNIFEETGWIAAGTVFDLGDGTGDANDVVYYNENIESDPATPPTTGWVPNEDKDNAPDLSSDEDGIELAPAPTLRFLIEINQ